MPDDAAAPDLSADIAAFLAENPDQSQIVPESETPTDESADESEDSDESAADEADESDESDEDETEAKPEKAAKVDVKAIEKAIADKDLPAFLEALGPAADELLTSKAHKTLRVQVREIRKAQEAAVKDTAKAKELETTLNARFGDAVDVRKAVQASSPDAVDKFIDYAEKAVGADWVQIQRWVAQGLVGRNTRLEQKKQADTTAQTAAQAKQATAVQETKTWITDGIKKVDATLLTDAPEVVDLVFEAMRAGFKKGIDTPAKALPLVLKKLEAEHARLTKVIARAKKGKKPAAAPAPAARVASAKDTGKTREATLEENIAEIKKSMRLR